MSPHFGQQSCLSAHSWIVDASPQNIQRNSLIGPLRALRARRPLGALVSKLIIPRCSRNSSCGHVACTARSDDLADHQCTHASFPRTRFDRSRIRYCLDLIGIDRQCRRARVLPVRIILSPVHPSFAQAVAAAHGAVAGPVVAAVGQPAPPRRGHAQEGAEGQQEGGCQRQGQHGGGLRRSEMAVVHAGTPLRTTVSVAAATMSRTDAKAARSTAAAR